MVRRRYLCGMVAACAVAGAATVAFGAQQPAHRLRRTTPTSCRAAGPGGALLVPLPMPEILKQYQSDHRRAPEESALMATGR